MSKIRIIYLIFFGPVLLTGCRFFRTIQELDYQFRQPQLNITSVNKSAIAADTDPEVDAYAPALRIGGTAFDAGGIGFIRASLNGVCDNSITVTGAQQWSACFMIPAGRNNIGFELVHSNDPDVLNLHKSIIVNYFWVQAPPMNYPRCFHDSIVFDSMLYVIGGNDDACKFMERLDTKKQMWETVDTFNYKWKYLRVAADDKYIYLSGGKENAAMTNALRRFDPENLNIDDLTPGIFSKALHGFVPYNNALYSIGGYNLATGEYYDSIEIYDIASDQWNTAARLPLAMAGFGYAQNGNLVYLTGGGCAAGILDTLYLLDLDTLNTRLIQDHLPYPVNNPASVFRDNKIYVIGGIRGLDIIPETGYIYLDTQNQVLIYSLAAEKWTEGYPMKSERAGLSADILDTSIYSIGGVSKSPLNSTKTIESWMLDYE